MMGQVLGKMPAVILGLKGETQVSQLFCYITC